MSEQAEEKEVENKNGPRKSEKRKRRNINVYKANSKNTGSAAQFSMSRDNDCMFMECAKQIAAMDSERPYDWDNKICVKLGVSDIAKLLEYLTAKAPEFPLKLFHQTPGGGNKSVELKYQEYKGRPGYFMSVSAQKPDGDATKLSIPIGMDEAQLLLIALKRGVELILGW